jgi:hypothetical protein
VIARNVETCPVKVPRHLFIQCEDLDTIKRAATDTVSFRTNAQRNAQRMIDTVASLFGDITDVVSHGDLKDHPHVAVELC